MKTYKIFENPTGQYEAVKQGWSWPGFFFGIIWACVKKMWALGLGLLALFFVLGIVSGSSGEQTALDGLINLLSLGVSIWLGAQGNKLREKNLLKRGYHQAQEVVQAGNPEAAIALYVSQYKKSL